MSPSITVFCFPHAGGGASSYRNWGAAFTPAIAVKVLQLPGREYRFNEAPIALLADAVTDLQRQVLSEANGPFAFFGHSMGALLAYELSHRLRVLGKPEPLHLFVSACRAPQLTQVDEPFSTLPNAAFVSELSRRYGGIPAQILADAEFLAAILPAIRADFTILHAYERAERPPLACPITAFGGLDDPIVRPDALEGWREQTAGTFELELFEGDHFYLQAQRAPLAASIAASLESNALGTPEEATR